MKAYVIKNKDGKYFGVANNYNYEHYWTTLDFAHYFRYFEGHDAKTEAEEYKNTRYPDCEVVEITIAEGDLEKENEVLRNNIVEFIEELAWKDVKYDAMQSTLGEFAGSPSAVPRYAKKYFDLWKEMFGEELRDE